MTFRFAAIAAAALALGASSAANATVIAEVEGNNDFASAQSLDGAFSLDANAEIGSSTTRPHATVQAGPGDGTFDYYSFSALAGAVGQFDIDHGMPYFDSYLALFDSAQNLLATNDDGGCCDAGTSHSYDAFLNYSFSSTGTYFIRVGNYPYGSPQSGGAGYALNVSLDNHPTQGAGGVPEPATWALMLLGFGGAGAMIRSRRRQPAAA